MNLKTLWFLAAIAISGAAVADPLRYRTQPERARAWGIDSSGLYMEEAGKPRMAVRLPGWQWAAMPYASPPDIAIGPRGEVLVTSNVIPVLWRIEPDTLAVSVHSLELDADDDKEVGFSRLVYSRRDDAYIAVSGLQHGTMWRIDSRLSHAQKLGGSQ